MSLVVEMRRRARAIIGPVLGISFVVFFAYHLVQGERGLMASMRLNQQVREAKTTLAALEAERTALERRVDLLRSDHLDPDLLDERARRELNLIGVNETVILAPEPLKRVQDDRGSQ
jgi:cell division protein FtsB